MAAGVALVLALAPPPTSGASAGRAGGKATEAAIAGADVQSTTDKAMQVHTKTGPKPDKGRDLTGRLGTARRVERTAAPLRAA